MCAPGPAFPAAHESLRCGGQAGPRALLSAFHLRANSQASLELSQALSYLLLRTVSEREEAEITVSASRAPFPIPGPGTGGGGWVLGGEA